MTLYTKRVQLLLDFLREDIAAHRVLRRKYIGYWHDVAMAANTDLLMRWWPQLKRCQRCRVLFLPAHGRQIHCDKRCAARARYLRYKAKPHKPRDYVHEYALRRASI